MASNSNPSSSSAESPSDVVYRGFLFKRGGFFKRWQLRYFKLHRDGTLDRFKVRPIHDDSEPTTSVTVIEFKMPDDPSAAEGEVLKTKCWDSGRVSKHKFRARNLREHNRWCNALNDAAIEGAIKITNWDEVVNPFMESGPSGSNSNVTKDNFTIVKLLEKGTYGSVHLGKLNDSDKYYAIKELEKKVVVKEKQVDHTKTECRVLFNIHPFLTSMTYAFQTENEIYFVMDYCIGGDLRFHLQEAKKTNIGFNLARTRFYAAEIAHVLGFLHSNKVVYRDLKPENVLLDHDGHIKLADFGLCKENIDRKNKTNTFCGTASYIAPEVLKNDAYGCAVDWWGLGVLVYEMVYRRVPFYDKDIQKRYRLIKRSPLEFPDVDTPELFDVDSTTRDFLTHLLKKNPKKRLGGTTDFAQLQVHPFFTGIDWTALYNRNVLPPFIPDVENAEDTKYFAREI